MGVKVNRMLYLPVYVCEGAHRPIRVAAENGNYAGYPPLSGLPIDIIERDYKIAINKDSHWGMYDRLHQHDDPSTPYLICYLGPDGLVTCEEVAGVVV